MNRRMIGDFSILGDAYRVGRPAYAADAVAWAMSVTKLHSTSIVADVGSGTGILTSAIAPSVSLVYAIEPSSDMRKQLSDKLSSVVVIDGTAEHTTLPKESVDAVFVGQALHWFDVQRCIVEWQRILRDPGWAVVMWNDLRTEDAATKSLRDLLDRHASVDLDRLGHRGIGRKALLSTYIAHGAVLVDERCFENPERLGFERVEAFLASVSYLPLPGSPAFQLVLNDVVNIVKANHGLVPWRTTAQIMKIPSIVPMG